ncbi:amidohydrolase family protein [Sphingomonas oligophenolica]|uniref:Amidohydrolase family protein n=1 Tax=Sphingomonas oligophenolica TaxID=301154 RepID=A0ABU9YB56_9SPHN
MHLIGGGIDAPFLENRSYTPPVATVDAFIAMLDTVGVDYGVVVQISVHGSDNRILKAALRRYPDRLRGVASIAGDEPEEELEELHALGVRGIRLNEHFAGGVSAESLSPIAEICRRLGWHLDLGLTAGRLRATADDLRRLDLPFVLDHLGTCLPGGGIAHPDNAAVIALARNENCWIKLSGLYRLSAESSPYRDMIPLVQACCSAAPDRVIWGSDWPNVALFDPDKVPETGAQLDAMAELIPDRALLQAILVDNPGRLFGSPGLPSPDSKAAGHHA